MIGNNRLAKTIHCRRRGRKIKLLHVINAPQTICNIHSLVYQTKKSRSVMGTHAYIQVYIYIRMYTCIINESHSGIIYKINKCKRENKQDSIVHVIQYFKMGFFHVTCSRVFFVLGKKNTQQTFAFNTLNRRIRRYKDQVDSEWLKYNIVKSISTHLSENLKI